MNVDGTGVHRVSAAEVTSSASPSWSPDGLHIAYNDSGGAVQAIWTADADGSQQHYRNVPGYFAVCGPNAIAFDQSSGGHSRIFLMDPDGSNIRQISQDTLDDHAELAVTGMRGMLPRRCQGCRESHPGALVCFDSFPLTTYSCP